MTPAVGVGAHVGGGARDAHAAVGLAARQLVDRVDLAQRLAVELGRA